MFKRAVMNSGGGVSPMMDSKSTAEDRYAFWQMVLTEAGVETLEQLRAMEVSELFAIWQRLKKSSPKYGMVASPCIDGIALTQSGLTAAENGAQKDIPYMMGSTSEDMAPPIIAGMAKDWCVRQAKQQKQPSYCWYFDRKLPGDDNGAWHSSELWYFFGTLKNGWRPFTDHDYKISEAMATALCNFAKTGNPNGEGLPTWEPTLTAKDQIMIWGEKEPYMGKPSKLKQWITMFTNKAVGE
jgi:para-nitrobenzyl esterase